MSDQATLTGGVKDTEVVHCKKDSFDVYIGRGRGDGHILNTEIGERGWLGNPFPVDEHGRVQCIERFRKEFEARLDDDEEFREAVEDLRGETLGCWCKPKACHGDVIVEYLEEDDE